MTKLNLQDLEKVSGGMHKYVLNEVAVFMDYLEAGDVEAALNYFNRQRSRAEHYDEEDIGYFQSMYLLYTGEQLPL